MIIGRNRFNIYLLAALALVLVAGCKTKSDAKDKKDEHDKEIASLRVHLEVIHQAMDFSSTVPILRENPVMITIDKSPFLTDLNVTSAKVVDVLGGFNLEIQLDRQGTWLLETYTVSNPGKHLAIFSAFGDKKKKQARWLGAPVITRKISNGILSFSPDASREETVEIADGLNNAARANEEKSKW